MKMPGSILISACILSSFAAAGQETLSEAVRRQRGGVEVIVLREFSPVELPELVKECDLIARVLVLDDGRGRLSKNERSIDSDYTVQVLDKFFSQRTVQSGDNVVVTKPGGAMRIDGYQVTAFERDFPAFQAGEEYILLLRFDASSGRYVLPYGAQGAFRNLGGTIEQVSKEGTWNHERGRVPILAFTQELGEVINSR